MLILNVSSTQTKSFSLSFLFRISSFLKLFLDILRNEGKNCSKLPSRNIYVLVKLALKLDILFLLGQLYSNICGVMLIC